MERPASDPLTGRLLDGRYLVGERIARGGMATVYESTDLRLDRLVALKIMPDALAEDESFGLRFVREARAAARLTHPNVVAVYDQGDDDGLLFLAMEFVPGRHTLRDVIRKEAPLTPARALGFVEPVLQALAAAHDAGIVHRDVKPENVLIDPHGQVKVADFGLARAISAATAATATGGVLMGTVSYLPPELVTDGSADARSDVYALGVLTFELLTGTKPHTGETPIQVAYKHVHEDVPAPSSVVAGIPPYVDAFVLRATSRQRELRPPDAHVMLQQLRRVRQALDAGVRDDIELTTDLTPTVPVAAAAAGLAAPSSIWEAPPGSPDDVFDVSRYDDFSPTLVVGSTTPAMLEEPVARDVEPPAMGPVQPSRPPSRRGRGWVALVLVLLLAAGAALAGWWYGVGRFQPTPNVVSMSQAKAEQKVKAAGLTFKVSDSAYSETVKAGNVISTDPMPGDNVLKNGTVTAVISKGPERHDVPDVKGMPEAAAVAKITGDHLSVGTTDRRWSTSVPEGEVIKVSPKAGTPLPRDGKVDLVVSKGPKPIELTSYQGESADAAAQELADLGLKVKRKSSYDDHVAAGVVISQSPDSGTVHAGDTVTLYVSKGPHLVEVPKVVYSGVDSATTALEQAGFKVDVLHASHYYGLGFVVSQSPDGGEMAPLGSTVKIYIT